MADLEFPTSLPDFQRLFPDDAACAACEGEIAEIFARHGVEVEFVDGPVMP